VWALGAFDGVWAVFVRGSSNAAPADGAKGGVSRPTARTQPQTGKIPRCGTVIDTVFIMLIRLPLTHRLYMDCVVVWYLCTG
jgi:hypothetical protein